MNIQLSPFALAAANMQATEAKPVVIATDISTDIFPVMFAGLLLLCSRIQL